MAPEGSLPEVSERGNLIPDSESCLGWLSLMR